MLRDRIDRTRLVKDIATGAEACADAKRSLRRRWDGPMADVQKRLARLRREMTERLVLLAWARGKLHVVAAPRAVRDAKLAWDAAAHAARVAERVALDYGVTVATEGRP
jgi:hypothetical protein